MANTANTIAYCSYYQAYVDRRLCWFVVATLKSNEHVAFDRTIDAAANLLEFFVPPAMEQSFLSFMNHFEKEGLVRDCVKMPNRLELPGETF